MKRSISTVIFSVLCFSVLLCCTKNRLTYEAGSASGAASSSSLDYTNLTASNHPRVIFTDDDFEEIVEMYAAGTNPYLNQIHDIVISLADSYVGASDLVYKLTGKRLLTVSRNAEARILCCAYAYKTTGETKYLEQAEKDLQTVCGFDDWNGSTHFLDVGEMATGVALGYDWLYNELSNTTKTLVRSALNNYAFNLALNGEMSTNIYAVTTNWNQVCNGGLISAALATYENNTSVATTIIDNGLSSNISTMEFIYYPDGNYPEGYSYWNYGTTYEALMLTALETAVGSDNGLSSTSGFSKTGKYMIYMEGPSGMCYNYSDCTSNTEGCPAQWYFAWKFGDLSVLYLEKDRVSSYKSCSTYRLLPVIAWYVSKVDVTDVPAPVEPIFQGGGTTPVVLIHDTWSMDENDKYLGIKGGKGTTTHSHLDGGSFVYDADGVRWAWDFVRQDYSSLESYIDLWDLTDGSERWTSFRLNNFNHNTISVNDAYHLSAGVSSFTEIIDSDGRKGATIDISAPLSGEVSSAIRTIYMEGDDLVIEDRITALSDVTANVRWTMVTPAEVEVAYGIVTLRSGNKTRYLTYTSSTGHKVVWTEWSTVSTHSWDDSNDGYYECGYTMTVNAGSTATVTVRLTPNDPL